MNLVDVWINKDTQLDPGLPKSAPLGLLPLHVEQLDIVAHLAEQTVILVEQLPVHVIDHIGWVVCFKREPCDLRCFYYLLIIRPRLIKGLLVKKDDDVLFP